MESELEAYNLQLEQVQTALSKDPQSSQLRQLELDLKNIIQLTDNLIKSKKLKTNPVNTTPKELQAHENIDDYKIGTKIQAKYATDGKWYEAIIHDVDPTHSKYTISYIGYNITEIVTADRIRQVGTMSSDGEKVNKVPLSERDKAILEKKKLKREKYKTAQSQIEEDSRFRQNAWLEFQSKTFKVAKTTGQRTRTNRNESSKSPSILGAQVDGKRAKFL